MKGPACGYCGGTGVEPDLSVPRCMSCGVVIESLMDARRLCQRSDPNQSRRAHTLSIGDEIRLGRKFKQSDLREWLGKDWKAEVERIKTR